MLLFVTFQLWGSDLVEQARQSGLRQELSAELAGRGPAPRGHPTGIGPGTTAPAGPAPTTAGPAEGQPVGRLQIPTIGVDEVVVEGVAAGDLAGGPGHYPGTALPGQAGNSAIAGHRTTHGHPFYDLQALGPGDDMVITTVQGVFVYVVVGSQLVDPSDTSVLAPTADPTLTLTTCNPRFSAAQRLVVRADLARAVLSVAPGRGRPAPGVAVRGPGIRPAVGLVSTERAVDGAGGGSSPPGARWWAVVGWGATVALSVAAAAAAARRVRPGWAAYVAVLPLTVVATVAELVRLDALLPPGF